MTDWIVAIMTGKSSVYPAPNAAKIAAAGNDLTMPGGMGDFNAMMNGLRSGSLSRRQLQINVTRIVRMARALAKG